MAYASRSDLAAYTGADAPAQAERLLERASELIDSKVIAPYTVDDDDMPSDATQRQAFRDATCAQVEWWIETGDEKGVLAAYSSVSIGSLSLSRGSAGSSAMTGEALAPRARVHLANADLLYGAIGQW